MRIAVLANLMINAPQWEGMPPDKWDDLDSARTPDGICAALERGGHQAIFLEASIHPPFNLIERLREYKPDLCFNISESHFGDARESQIPALLEMLRIPYTGSGVMTLALALDKPMTKRVLAYHGLPTPEFQVFERADEPLHSDLLNEAGELRWPLFVKPSAEGTSMGVTGESVVNTIAQLRDQVAKQFARYEQPILVERYIKGREVMVGMVGNIAPSSVTHANERAAYDDLPEGLHFFPVSEVDLTKYDESEGGAYTSRMKIDLADDYHYFCPAPLSDAQVHDLQRIAAGVFRAVGCKDVARIDFRLDADDGDKPYVLEINPLPGINPNYSDLCLQALADGWEHDRLVNTIVNLAAARHGLKAAGSS